MAETFYVELKNLINRHSKENGSDTPDWILADYLEGCLESFNKTVKAREKWYGRDMVPASVKPQAPMPKNPCCGK